METTIERHFRLLARFAATFTWMWLGIAIPFLTSDVRSVEVMFCLFVSWAVLVSVVSGVLGYHVSLPTPPRFRFLFCFGVVAWAPLLLGILLTFTEIGWLARSKLAEIGSIILPSN